MENVRIRTWRPEASWSAAITASRVKGQFVPSQTVPATSAASRMAQVIHSHLGKRMLFVERGASINTPDFGQLNSHAQNASSRSPFFLRDFAGKWSGWTFAGSLLKRMHGLV